MSSLLTTFQAQSGRRKKPFLLSEHIQVHHPDGGHLEYRFVELSSQVDANHVATAFFTNLGPLLLSSVDIVNGEFLLILIFAKGAGGPERNANYGCREHTGAIAVLPLALMKESSGMEPHTGQ